MARKRKNPKVGVQIEKKRIPRAVIDPSEYDQLPPQWSFALFDDLDWARENGPAAPAFLSVAARLRSMEGQTWKTILANNKKNHHIPIFNIIREAQKRIENLKHEERGEILSLRLGGKLRLWGWKEGRSFFVLWWDPDHQVCPSNKRHT